MPTINIPSAFIPGIKMLTLLSDTEFSNVLEDLRKMDSSNSKEDLQELLQTYLDEEQSLEISESLFSFGYLLIRNTGDTSELAADITDAFISYIKDDDDEEENREIFVSKENLTLERLSDVLVLSDFLLPIFEGIRAVFQGNTVLLSSDISSEIIITNDRKFANPATGIIVNKLRINTKRDDQSSFSIITLDRTDLIELKKQIERALNDLEEMQKSYKDFINFIQV